MGARTERVALRPPLLPMTARSVAELPTSEGRWAYEPKMDGFRCLAFRQPRGKVILQSRQQRPLTRYFPEVVAELQEQISGGVVLDGELEGVLVVRPGTRCHDRLNARAFRLVEDRSWPKAR